MASRRRQPFDSLCLYSGSKMKEDKNQRIPLSEITNEKENEHDWETIEQMRDTAWNWDLDTYADPLSIEQTASSVSGAGLMNQIAADSLNIKFNPRAASSPIVKDIGMFEDFKTSAKQVYGTFNSHGNYLNCNHFKDSKKNYKTFNSHVHYSKVKQMAKENSISFEEKTVGLNADKLLDEAISKIQFEISISKNSFHFDEEILQEETLSFIQIAQEISKICLEDVPNTSKTCTIQETAHPIKTESSPIISTSNANKKTCKSPTNSDNSLKLQGSMKSESFTKLSIKKKSCHASSFLKHSIQISPRYNLSHKTSINLSSKADCRKPNKNLDLDKRKYRERKQKTKTKKISHEISYEDVKMLGNIKLDRPTPSFARIKQHRKKLANTPICCLTTLNDFNL